MRRFLLFPIFILVILTGRSQPVLFDDTRVSSILITIPSDSLEILYDSVLSDHYYRVRFIFQDASGADTLEQAGFRLRGNTSRYSAKKSFKISFNEYVPGRKYQGVKKLNLNGEHNDPTMIREKLYYDLWNRAGFPSRRSAFVRLYINGDYYGLYTCLEEMDKEWLNRVFPDAGGNLYKCTWPADLRYRGPDPQVYKDLQNSTVTGGRVYDLKTNEAEDDYTGLVRLISLLHLPADSLFADSIVRVLDVGGFLKCLALDVSTGNWDNYSYNRNNYYLYDSPDDRRFRFITYDPDNNCGIDWFGIDWGVRDALHWPNPQVDLPLVEKLLAVPEFFDLYQRHLDTMARIIVHPDSVFPRIHALRDLIQQAALEDEFRTLDYGYTFSDFLNSYDQPLGAHVPYGLKPFIAVRSQATLDQLDPDGTEEEENGLPLMKVFPNPATDRIFVRMQEEFGRVEWIRIVDPMGRRIAIEEPTRQGNALLSIPVRDLPPGIYYLTVQTDRKAGTVLFIRK